VLPDSTAEEPVAFAHNFSFALVPEREFYCKREREETVKKEIEGQKKQTLSLLLASLHCKMRIPLCKLPLLEWML